MRSVDQPTPEWTPEPHPWCAKCSTDDCGCPTGDALTIGAHIELGQE